MSQSRVIPTQDDTDLPTFTILVEGEELGARFGVLGVVVSRNVNSIPKARLLLADGSASDGGFMLSDGDTFLPGKEVEIRGGYHNTEDIIFKGLITGHGIKAPERGSSYLQIDLRGEVVKMTVSRKNRSFVSMNDTEIIEEMLGAYGLANEVEETSVTHAQMVQYGVTDWDFMVSRAEMNGCLVFTDDDMVRVNKPDTGAEPALNLAYGSNVISFEAGMDARRQYGSFNSTGWDYAGQALAEEEGDSPAAQLPGNADPASLASALGNPTYYQQHPGRRAEGELSAWSDARLLRAELSKVRGTVRIAGFSDIRPGMMISMERFGERFDGNAFVSSVHHQFSGESSWYTDIGFGLDPQWHVQKFTDLESPAASAMLPSVKGLQPAVVTAIHDDPDGENRIRVRMPLVEPQGEGIWARVAVPDAGTDRGMTFRPEVDDEVLIGFINDDPRDAVILGMLHSRDKPAPIEATEENNEKGWVTRSGLRLIFNDEDKSVTIETPGGNRLEVSEDAEGITLEDQNSNRVVLNGDGISITSSGDIKLEAQGDVTINGMNISAEASASFKAEGGSGAALSSNGQTEVKGSLVAIN